MSILTFDTYFDVNTFTQRNTSPTDWPFLYLFSPRITMTKKRFSRMLPLWKKNKNGENSEPVQYLCLNSAQWNACVFPGMLVCGSVLNNKVLAKNHGFASTEQTTDRWDLGCTARESVNPCSMVKCIPHLLQFIKNICCFWILCSDAKKKFSLGIQG